MAMEQWQVCGHFVGNCGSSLAENCYCIKFRTGFWNCVDRLVGWKDIKKIISPMSPEMCDSVSPAFFPSRLASSGVESSSRFAGTIVEYFGTFIWWLNVFAVGFICMFFVCVFYIREQNRQAIAHKIRFTAYSPPRLRRRVQ